MATTGTGRARAGARRRCTDPTDKGCKQFARRGTVPPVCSGCGGGTRAQKKHTIDPESGAQVTRSRGLINIPPRVAALLDGSLDVADLDEEELAHGYPRAADGSFRAPPTVIPKSLHDRMVRELFSRADQELKQNLLKVTQQMTKIATDPDVDAATRLKASQYVYERLRGKVADVVVTGDVKEWEEVLEGVYRGPRRGPEGTIVDAEVVDDGREP